MIAALIPPAPAHLLPSAPQTFGIAGVQTQVNAFVDNVDRMAG